MAQPVKWFRSDMRGAPVRNGTPGSGVAQYAACLITGFGDTPMISGQILDNKATFAFGAGLTFFKDSVISVQGATPSALNDEHIVRASTDNTVTINTGLPNGPISGTVTVKYAPVGGWSMPYTGPNTAVFRSLHPESLGHYYLVTDTNALWCGVRGFESMTSVSEGRGFYPPNDTNTTVGAMRWKSETANTQQRHWFFIGDARGFYDVGRAYQFILTPMDHWYTPWYTGDLLMPPGIIDNYASIVQGGFTTNYNVPHSTCLHYSSTGTINATDFATTLARNVYGDALTVKRARTSFSSMMTGRYSGNGSIPYVGARRKLSLMPPRVLDDENQWRGTLPGVYCTDQTIPPAPQSSAPFTYPFPNFDVRDGANDFFGRRLMSVMMNDTSGSANMNNAPPVVFFDLHGPWR